MMIAILSVTPDHLYLFNLPFAMYSWHKLGVKCVVITPKVPMEDIVMKKAYFLVTNTLYELGIKYKWDTFAAPKEKEPTFAQCSRLYAAANSEIDMQEVLVTGDSDMCVFNQTFWKDLPATQKVFHVIGNDLVPDGQLPMCYIMASAKEWRKAMKIGGRNLQQCLDDLLGHIETDNFRGNYWCKDQEEAYDKIVGAARNDDDGAPVWFHKRAYRGTQLASQRADRDGWPDPIPSDILDAHLPRPGYLLQNFGKIYKLFTAMYPEDNLSWMYEYWNKYTDLI